MAYQPGESGNPDGRPKVTLADFPEGWVEDAIGLYSRGAADIEIRGQVFGGMSHDLWTRLLAEEPLFSETVNRGRILSESWWYEQGRTALHLDKFQNGPYALHMQNRFNFNSKVSAELTGKDGGPIQTEGAVHVYLPDNGRSG